MSVECTSMLEALDELRSLFEELRVRGRLRLGLSYVRVSDLVEQVKCEARLEAILGSERTIDERVKELIKLSEYVLGARSVVRRERLQVVTIPVVAVIHGVPIVAKPRGLVLRDCRVEAVIYTSLSKRPTRFYQSDRVRAHAFCAVILYSPLPRISNPVFMHVKAVDKQSLIEALTLLRKGLEEGVETPLVGEGYAVHRLVCSEHVVKELEPLLAYWLGVRDARRTPGPWCSDCPLRSECPYAGEATATEGL